MTDPKFITHGTSGFAPKVEESKRTDTQCGILFGGDRTMDWHTDKCTWEQQIDDIMKLAEDWGNTRHNFIVGDRSLALEEKIDSDKQALRRALWSFHAWHAVEYRNSVQPLREKIEGLELALAHALAARSPTEQQPKDKP